MLDRAPISPTLEATDLDRAKRFYGVTLGLTVAQETDTNVMLAAGDGTAVLLFAHDPNTDDHTAAGFLVDDIQTTVKELEARGVRFEDYDQPNVTTVGHIADRPGGRSAWFRDSEGNLLAVHEPTNRTERRSNLRSDEGPPTTDEQPTIRVIPPEERTTVPGPPDAPHTWEEIYADGHVWIGMVATDPGAVSPWHHHGEHISFVYPLEGEGLLELDADGSQRVGVQADGSLMVVPAGVPHRESNPADTPNRALVIRIGHGPPLVLLDPPEPDRQNTRRPQVRGRPPGSPTQQN